MRLPRWATIALSVLTPLAVLGLLQWWATSAEALYFPAPWSILQELRSIWLFDRFGSDLLPSVARLSAGLLVGCAAGYLLGLGLALGPRFLRYAVDPVLEFIRAIPPSMFLPIVLVVFGVGSTGKVLVIALGAFFPVLLNTIDGVREIDPLLYDMCASYGIRTRREVIGRVVVPASMPRVFAGLQTGLALALILMVISEMVASPDGLGRFIFETQRTFAIKAMWSGIVVLGVLGFLLNSVLRGIEKRVLRWHRATHGEASA